MCVCDGTACGGRKRGSRSQSWLGTERSVRSCTRQAQGAWGGGDAGHLFVVWVISGWEFTDEQNTKKKKSQNKLPGIMFRSRRCGPETYTVWVSLEDKEHTSTSFLQI